MKITRERYLDDTNRWGLKLELVTRTNEMHSAMDALPSDVRQAIGDVLVEALGKVAALVEPVAIERGAKPVHV